MDKDTPSYFHKPSEINRCTEPAKIKEVEYNTEGSILSYTTGESLKLFSANNLSVRNIITANIDKYKFLQEHTLIHSTGTDMFYLSVYDNKYLREFKSHEAPINSISVNSDADTIMSVTNKEILMWDIRKESPIKKLNAFHSLAALSNHCNYAVASNSFIRIYDIRNDSQPLVYKAIPSNFYKKISYSPDGSFIILKTESSYTFLDSYGETSNFITLESPNDGDITPDSQFLLCPSKFYIFAYRISDRKKVDSINTKNDCNRIVRVNPYGNQFVVTAEKTIQLFNI
ncbi:hypothetical protein NUSPORA_01504 [Nucleospora cyclopteri]